MTDGPVRPPFGRARARLRTAFLGLFTGLAAACASSGGSGPAAPTETINLLPARSGFDPGDFTNRPSSVRDTVLAEPHERIWAALPYVFQTLGVETTTLDARSYAIGNERWRASAIHGTRLSSFLQCGSGIVGPNADFYEVTMLLMVQLESQGASATLVRTVLDAYARPRSGSGAAIQCASQGTLEVRVVRLLGEAMARGMAGEGSLIASGAGGVAPGLPASAGLLRLPSYGDFVRVGCLAAPAGETWSWEGGFQSASASELLLEVGSPSRSVSMPSSSVVSMQIRERRSRARVGALVLGALGGAAGGYVARQGYDPDGNLHFGPGFITAIGVVVGGIGGALVGGVGGSLMDYDVWLDVTPDWQARFGTPAPEPGTDASIGGGCAGA